MACPHGNFDDSWWAGFLPELHCWRATRSRSGDFLTARARVRFAGMSQAWAAVVEPNLGSDIEGLQWADVSAFPAIVAEIKDVDSPVFAFKFCHFVAPRVFPLVDNAAMGNEYFTYADCFRAYKREWMTTTAKGVREELVVRLADLVGPAPAPDYPFKNKPVELCLIGRHQGGPAPRPNGLGREPAPKQGAGRNDEALAVCSRLTQIAPWPPCRAMRHPQAGQRLANERNGPWR